jgi:predicted PurR-regulated permease PerM
MPVLAPAIIWLYWTGSTGSATGLVIWSLPVVALDNVMRPMLIRRGVQLPMLLIIAGVIGGLISFGVVGLFVGPVMLAATYTLAKDWVERGQSDAPQAVGHPDVENGPD